MRKFDRFKKAAEVKITFDSMSDRKLYLKANNKYSIIIGFVPVLNDKCTVKYARYTFDCSCGHAAMRAMPNQAQNFCSHILAAIHYLVEHKGKFQ